MDDLALGFVAGFNYNCTAVNGYALGQFEVLGVLPWITLCREYTKVAEGLLHLLVLSCRPAQDKLEILQGLVTSSHRNVGSALPGAQCPNEGDCLGGSVHRMLSNLQWRMKQKATLAARLVRNTVGMDPKSLQMLTPSCLSLLSVTTGAGESQCMELVDLVMMCMTTFTSHAMMFWRFVSAVLSVQQTGLAPEWYYSPLAVGTDLSAGEGSLEEPPVRCLTLIELLKTVAASSDGRVEVAEIGVNNAATSTQILRRVPGVFMYLVDIVQHSTARDRLREFQHRHVFLIDKSVDAAAAVENESLNLVFIDGDHSYDGARDDICAWTPKVMRGGIIAGHDYSLKSVGRAVNEFVLRHKLALHLDGESWWTWLPSLVSIDLAAGCGHMTIAA